MTFILHNKHKIRIQYNEMTNILEEKIKGVLAPLRQVATILI